MTTERDCSRGGKCAVDQCHKCGAIFPSAGSTPSEGDLMALVDEYADAFHGAMRPDGGIQFADGLVAKGKKDALRAALRAALNPRDSVVVAAVLAYDAAIRACADDPEKMASFCTAEGDDLDMLYAHMLNAAQQRSPLEAIIEDGGKKFCRFDGLQIENSPDGTRVWFMWKGERMAFFVLEGSPSLVPGMTINLSGFEGRSRLGIK